MGLAILKAQGRTIGVVHKAAGSDIFVVTAFFDRGCAPMRTSYDPKVDALFVHLTESPTFELEAVAPGVIFDFDENGRLVRIELLNASEKVAAGALATAAE